MPRLNRLISVLQTRSADLSTLLWEPFKVGRSSTPVLPLVLTGLMICFLVGCGDGNPYRVVPVSGKLTIDGKPLPGVRIKFSPAQGRPSLGTTDATGSFTPWYRGEQDGVQTGVHTITLEQAEQDELIDVNSKRFKNLQLLLNRYGEGGSSVFTIEITEATDDLKIELTSSD